jgi:hypothetical protein
VVAWFVNNAFESVWKELFVAHFIVFSQILYGKNLVKSKDSCFPDQDLNPEAPKCLAEYFSP